MQRLFCTSSPSNTQDIDDLLSKLEEEAVWRECDAEWYGNRGMPSMWSHHQGEAAGLRRAADIIRKAFCLEGTASAAKEPAPPKRRGLFAWGWL